MNLPPNLDLGHLLEGVVELDPMTDTVQLRTVDQTGAQICIPLADLLKQYEGREVRLTLVPLESLMKIQAALEEAGQTVQAVMPEDLDGVSRQVTRKPD